MKVTRTHIQEGVHYEIVVDRENDSIEINIISVDGVPYGDTTIESRKAAYAAHQADTR